MTCRADEKCLACVGCAAVRGRSDDPQRTCVEHARGLESNEACQEQAMGMSREAQQLAKDELADHPTASRKKVYEQRTLDGCG